MSLKIVSTKSSRQRLKVGDDEITTAIYDVASESSIQVTTVDKHLDTQATCYDVFESSMPYCISAFLFADSGNLSEEQFKQKFLDRIKQTEST